MKLPSLNIHEKQMLAQCEIVRMFQVRAPGICLEQSFTY